MVTLNNAGTTALRPLEVGTYPVKTAQVTIVSGQNLTAGAVLGKITSGGKYNLSLAAAEDGSEDIQPVVLAEDCDASGGDKTATVYTSGAFDASKLTIGTGHDLAAVRAAWVGTPMFAQTVA